MLWNGLILWQTVHPVDCFVTFPSFVWTVAGVTSNAARCVTHSLVWPDLCVSVAEFPEPDWNETAHDSPRLLFLSATRATPRGCLDVVAVLPLKTKIIAEDKRTLEVADSRVLLGNLPEANGNTHYLILPEFFKKDGRKIERLLFYD